MRQQYPFRVDSRFLKDYCELPLESLFRGDALNFASRAAAAAVVADSSSDWQRVAGLVQSPVSANSEGSSTSTPDQCPASPALTFCEMPSSRNGSCNHSLSEMQQQQHVWKAIPSEQTAVSTSQAAPQLVSSDKDGFFHDQTLAAWNPILSHCDMSIGALATRSGLISQSCTPAASPQHLSMAKPLSGKELQMVYPLELQTSQVVKQEEEYFLGGRNGLVIDDKLLSFQRTGSSSHATNSKIGNFMDLLRQSDRPITDATIATAVSCSHLSQLLSGQEAPEMWIAHSNRLPAMLSEVMPSNSSGRCSESFELRNKRKSSTSDVDIQDHSSTVQHHEGRKSQDEDEPLSDRVTVQTTNECELFSKRPKIENSNFPFKMQVRKEKLGERISALQQLVSPFGKTDTASVLLEAIGYIKFLHEQVQVLSSPYMKHNTIRHTENGQESKHDLRSRGLCLVPVSCTLRVANDNGADYWTPTLHGGIK